MAEIDCEMRGFGASRSGLSPSVHVNRLQLLRAAALVGTPMLTRNFARPRPLLEMLWRVAMVLANIRLDATGQRWMRSEAYDRLDPSEKTAVSYFLGMIQAELTTREHLGYTHLVHVDALLLASGAPLAGTRPDFVAVEMRRGKAAYGATVEAKGRTNGFDASALSDAKTQARQIPMLAGLTARETIASEAHFGRKGLWESVLEDPEWTGETLEVGLEGFLQTYYRNVIEAGRETGVWARTGEAYGFTLPDYPLFIAVPELLVNAYDQSLRESPDPTTEGPLVQAWQRLAASSAETSPSDFIQVRFEANDDTLIEALFKREDAQPRPSESDR